MLLARIYEVFPLVCPVCHTEMRLVALITDRASITRILEHLGEPTQPPPASPARTLPAPLVSITSAACLWVPLSRVCASPSAQPHALS